MGNSSVARLVRTFGIEFESDSEGFGWPGIELIGLRFLAKVTTHDKVCLICQRKKIIILKISIMINTENINATFVHPNTPTTHAFGLAT